MPAMRASVAIDGVPSGEQRSPISTSRTLGGSNGKPVHTQAAIRADLRVIASSHRHHRLDLSDVGAAWPMIR